MNPRECKWHLLCERPASEAPGLELSEEFILQHLLTITVFALKIGVGQSCIARLIKDKLIHSPPTLNNMLADFSFFLIRTLEVKIWYRMGFGAIGREYEARCFKSRCVIVEKE